MLFSEYIPLAMRTMSPHSPTGKWEVDYLLHGLLGIVTELKELSESTGPTNTAEELSDICWFTAAIAKAVGYEGDPNSKVSPAWADKTAEDFELEVLTLSVHMMDLLKKQLFYGPSINLERWEKSLSTLHPLTVTLVNLVAALIQSHGHEPGKIFMLNIAKLSKRYADKFTDQAASIRDTTAEYAAMKANE